MSSENKIDDGGPAFPSACGSKKCDDGMTLRDWFAGQALAGSYAAWMAECRDTNVSSVNMAAECYLIADAMLKARTK